MEILNFLTKFKILLRLFVVLLLNQTTTDRLVFENLKWMIGTIKKGKQTSYSSSGGVNTRDLSQPVQETQERIKMPICQAFDGYDASWCQWHLFYSTIVKRIRPSEWWASLLTGAQFYIEQHFKL